MLKTSLKIVSILAVLSTQSVWAAINPLQIDELVTHAVQTHPLVGSAVADKRATTEGLTAAKLAFLPTPSVQSTYNQNDGPVVSLTVRQPLWTGGRLTASVNQAMNDDRAAAANILERQNEVAKNTIDIWKDYIYALSLQTLYRNQIKQLGEFEKMITRRVEKGVSARIERDLIKNRILQDESSLQAAIEQQKIAEARLEQIIGQPIASGMNNLQLTHLVQSAKRGSMNFETLAFKDAIQIHPSVIRQHYAVESAKHEMKVQQASRYPSVFIQLKNDYYQKTHDFDHGVMLGVSYDPGAGFSNLALSRASQARVDALMYNQEASRRTVMENIQTQYQQFVSARDQESALMASTSGAKIVLDSYRRQFIAGRKSWLEVLNAVRDQSQYEQQLRQAQAQMIASYYKLQVDFGLMPWQQSQIQALSIPNGNFNPMHAAQEWAMSRRKSLKNHSKAMVDTSTQNPSWGVAMPKYDDFGPMGDPLPDDAPDGGMHLHIPSSR
ncbi:TolC family protein [Moraxella sp. Tifton1]|uniref:TolC family protein n=1 Tax=Moraxella oculi TaxID=2940516 RepID=UPI0020132AE7|nr:TolC family protein [Moraxella sp. Tifton1]MCL1623218.1 TolC family protein [Moraxella sp. Tifton1]